MPVKQACSDNIEETISSTDEVAPERKRARVYNEAPPSSDIHITSNASFHLHITISHSCNSTSHGTILHEKGTVSWSVLNSGSKQTKQSSAKSSFDPCPRLPCSTTWVTVGTQGLVSEKRRIQDPPRTTETGR